MRDQQATIQIYTQVEDGQSQKGEAKADSEV